MLKYLQIEEEKLLKGLKSVLCGSLWDSLLEMKNFTLQRVGEFQSLFLNLAMTQGPEYNNES